MEYLKRILRTKDIRDRLLWTIALVFVYRVITHITAPVDNPEVVLDLLSKGQEGLGAFSALMGGSLGNFSLVLMGLSPYINASIIIQLMTVVIPKLEEISKEGDSGQKKIQKYTRYLTLPLAFVQSYGMMLLLNQSTLAATGKALFSDSSFFNLAPVMLAVTTGTMFLVWLGDKITEKGIGNGVSILIFSSIVSGMPSIIGSIFGIGDSSNKFIFVVLIAVTIMLTAFVIYLTESMRNIEVSYGSRQGAVARKSNLPIKLNQAGMIPIIFAMSLVTFPTIFAKIFMENDSAFLRSIAEFINLYLGNQGFVYVIIYFFLVVFFSFFYVSITFDTKKVAENIQKRGGFIHGIRPGKKTANYLRRISNSLNLWGGLALGLIAIFPFIFQKFTEDSGSVPLLITGAGLIIVVGTVLNVWRQIDAQMVMRSYKRMY